MSDDDSPHICDTASIPAGEMRPCPGCWRVWYRNHDGNIELATAIGWFSQKS